MDQKDLRNGMIMGYSQVVKAQHFDCCRRWFESN